MNIQPTVAYIINQYPRPSHTFIARELQALEALGVRIVRIAMRFDPGEIHDQATSSEQQKTHYILSQPRLSLAMAVLRCALANPLPFLRALGCALRLYRNAGSGLLVHLAYLVEACATLQLCRAEGVQHLHAHFGTNPTAVALLTKTLGGPGYSFTVHGPEEFDRPAALSLPEKIAGARFVVAISKYCRSQLYRHTEHAQWEKIRIVHCAIGEQYLELATGSLEPPGGSKIFVCVGRLCEQKGQLLLLDAFADIAAAHADARLVLIGDGPMRGQIEARIQNLGLDGQVEITGWKSATEIREYIRQCRATVLPSFAEGLPVVLMESLAMFVPAISTNIAGIGELIRDRQTGWLISPGCRPSLVAAMFTALQVPEDVRAEMGQAGRQLVEDNHSAVTEAGKLLGYIREVS